MNPAPPVTRTFMRYGLGFGKDGDGREALGVEQLGGEGLEVVGRDLVDRGDDLVEREVAAEGELDPAEAHHAVAHALEAEHERAFELALGLAERTSAHRLLSELVELADDQLARALDLLR